MWWLMRHGVVHGITDVVVFLMSGSIFALTLCAHHHHFCGVSFFSTNLPIPIPILVVILIHILSSQLNNNRVVFLLSSTPDKKKKDCPSKHVTIHNSHSPFKKNKHAHIHTHTHIHTFACSHVFSTYTHILTRSNTTQKTDSVTPSTLLAHLRLLRFLQTLVIIDDEDLDFLFLIRSEERYLMFLDLLQQLQPPPAQVPLPPLGKKKNVARYRTLLVFSSIVWV